MASPGVVTCVSEVAPLCLALTSSWVAPGVFRGIFRAGQKNGAVLDGFGALPIGGALRSVQVAPAAGTSSFWVSWFFLVRHFRWRGGLRGSVTRIYLTSTSPAGDTCVPTVRCGGNSF